MGKPNRSISRVRRDGLDQYLSDNPLPSYILRLPNERENVSWTGTLHSAARLCSERGTEACSIFSIVSHQISWWTQSPLSATEQHADFLCSYTFDEVSRLCQDTSTALATICEWRNSFIPINRVPLEILSLIPANLSLQDRFRASFVCRHWRKTFIQRAELWSELSFSSRRSGAYVETFLERAKGAALDITVGYMTPVPLMILLSPHAEQIKHVSFPCSPWTEIERISKAIPGPLPLLHSLYINIAVIDNQFGAHTTPSSAPLFGNAINLKTFRYHVSTNQAPSLRRFFFPNLVSFVFSARPLDLFPASELLVFLENSPTLRTVEIQIDRDISLEGVDQGRIVVLPNVETFSFVVRNGGPSYGIAALISCPIARSVSLAQRVYTSYLSREDYFPSPVLWHAIVRQCTRSSVEEVTLGMKGGCVIIGKLTFKSADATKIELYIEVEDVGQDEDEDENNPLSVRIHNKIFTQATRAIRNHLQLAGIKRLRIHHSFHDVRDAEVSHITMEAGRLFESVGSLDELAIHDCDLQPCFYHYFNPSANSTEEPVVFPQIKQLTISSPVSPSYEECITAIIGLWYFTGRTCPTLCPRDWRS